MITFPPALAETYNVKRPRRLVLRQKVTRRHNMVVAGNIKQLNISVYLESPQRAGIQAAQADHASFCCYFIISVIVSEGRWTMSSGMHDICRGEKEGR